MHGTSKPYLLPFGFVLAAFALFFAYSAPHLYDPPIGTHGWRQAIATSEARLYAAGQPFAYPRAEGCGAEPNVHMGGEFPLYSWTLGKLGGADGINLVGRLLGVLSALGLMLASFAIFRHAFKSWEEPYRSVAATAAGSFFAISPLFRFYGISFVPDLEAHALALLGIAVLAGPIFPRAESLRGDRPLTPLRLLVAALLLSLGCLTKMIAVPHLALAGVVLLDRARTKDGLAGLKALRPWLMALVLLAIVVVPAYLWYWQWVPILKKGGCELVWLPEKMDDSWRTMTFTDPEWRFRMSKWGREDLLGPLWITCLGGVLLFLTAGVRGALLLLWSLGCALGYVRLGWHTKQHDYDFLLVLPAFAMGFGATFGMGTRLLSAPASRLKVPERLGRIAPYLVLAAILAALSPGAHQQSRRHFYTGIDEVGMKDAVDKVLPEGEPIHYFGGRNDPRLPYFSARRAWGTEPALYCQKKDVSYDCVLAHDLQGHYSPCVERSPSVLWPNDVLVCSILHPEEPLALPRMLSTIAKKIRYPLDQTFPGVGRLLGSDPVTCGTMRVPCAGNMVKKDWLDVYFVPEAKGPAVQILADGKPLTLAPPVEQWPAGTIVVGRVELPSPLPSKIELKLKDTVVVLQAK